MAFSWLRRASEKPSLGTYLIAKRNCSTLVIIHTKPLLKQWRAQIGAFLERDEQSIGQIGDGGSVLHTIYSCPLSFIRTKCANDHIFNVRVGFGKIELHFWMLVFKHTEYFVSKSLAYLIDVRKIENYDFKSIHSRQ